jgi:hypothetical protein
VGWAVHNIKPKIGWRVVVELVEIKARLENYRNENLMRLFQTRLFMKDPETAFFNFKELKKLLFIIYLVQEQKIGVEHFDIFDQMGELDEMWHQFILMTVDYERFCLDVFGVFIHHDPEIPKLGSVAQYPEGPSHRSLRQQISLVMDIWGPETVENWYLKN